MHKLLVGTALACLASGAALAAAPTAATIITNADVQKVLKLGPKATDHTIRVVDMGQGYNMSVAVVHRGPTGVTPTRTPEQIAAAAAARAKATPCGLKAAPPGATVVDGHRSAPDSDVTTTLNGPSCSGNVTGDEVLTPMKVGDIAVIPAGIPHGWTGITSEVTYLSVRPDPKHVLPAAGYKYPGL